MNTIVVKFGGTSLASAEQIQKAAAIVRSNPARRFVVASAPGKRTSDDIKVTDLLYRCYEQAAAGENFEDTLVSIEARFAEILTGLGLTFALADEIATIRAHLQMKPQRDYMASRGEYLNSKIIAAYLGFPFVDAAQYVSFSTDGTFLAEETNAALHHALETLDCAVVPGFYGALPDGTIHTFSRGGSDVTGSIVARAVGAELYENWTDVSGMLAADPRIIDNPHKIEHITYQELRELSYMGAALEADLRARSKTILSLVERVEQRSPVTLAEYRRRLTDKMQEVLQSTSIDEGRILQEAAIYADKIAVDEETVRLRSHLSQLDAMLTDGGAIGRKLDFLLQELNREANTIGSKGNDIEQARTVVTIKAEPQPILRATGPARRPPYSRPPSGAYRAPPQAARGRYSRPCRQSYRPAARGS